MHWTQTALRQIGLGLGTILGTLCTALLVGTGFTWGALTVLEIYWRVVP